MTNTAIAITIATIAFLVFWYPMGIHIFKMLIGYVKDEPVGYEINCIFDDLSGCIEDGFTIENVSYSFLLLVITSTVALIIFLITLMVLELKLLIWIVLTISIIAVAYGLLRTARFITRRYTDRSK